MAQSNQPKKRKTSSPGKSVELETEKPAPLTLQEIAFINRTPPPPPEAKSKPDLFSEKLFQQVLQALIKQIQGFSDTHDGYYTRAGVMEAFDISSKNTLNSWIRKGLPFYQIDTKVFFKKSEMEVFIKGFRRIMPI